LSKCSKKSLNLPILLFTSKIAPKQKNRLNEEKQRKIKKYFGKNGG